MVKTINAIVNKLKTYRADVEWSESISGRNPPITPNTERGIKFMDSSTKSALNK